MKTGLILLLSIAFFTSKAQTNPAIKVLPTNKEGVIKLLVTGASDDPVSVKFYDNDGLIQSDEINAKTKGFNKKYDIRKIEDRDLVMEITTEGTSVTYRLATMKGKLVAHLVRTTYTYPIIASKD